MYRLLYRFAIVALLGGSAITAAGIDGRGGHLPSGAGLVLLASLQR